MLRKSVKWFKGQCSDSAKPKTLYFFAAKGFDSAVSILSRKGTLAQNTHTFNDRDDKPIEFSEEGVAKAAQSYRFGDSNQHQIVLIPWCSQQLLADLVIQSDVAILKPGGISTFQAVNMRIEAEKIRIEAASSAVSANRGPLEEHTQNISPPRDVSKDVYFDRDSGREVEEHSSEEESGYESGIEAKP